MHACMHGHVIWMAFEEQISTNVFGAPTSRAWMIELLLKPVIGKETSDGLRTTHSGILQTK